MIEITKDISVKGVDHGWELHVTRQVRKPGKKGEPKVMVPSVKVSYYSSWAGICNGIIEVERKKSTSLEDMKLRLNSIRKVLEAAEETI